MALTHDYITTKDGARALHTLTHAYAHAHTYAYAHAHVPHTHAIHPSIHSFAAEL